MLCFSKLKTKSHPAVTYFIYYSTQQYCHVEFPFKFFDKTVDNRDFLKISNLSKAQYNIINKSSTKMHFWKVFAYFWGWAPKSTPTIDWFTTFGHFQRSFRGICQIFAKTWGSTTVAMGPFMYYVSTFRGRRGEGGWKIAILAYFQYWNYAYIKIDSIKLSVNAVV